MGYVGKVRVRMDERDFCCEVAETNKLELLKWAREEKKCRWDVVTICAAAEHGNLEMVKYCVANDVLLICGRVQKLPIKVISRYSNIREEVKAPWDSLTAEWAAENGHLHILEYLVELKFDNDNGRVSWQPERSLDCLKYLHETAKAPWDYRPYK